MVLPVAPLAVPLLLLLSTTAALARVDSSGWGAYDGSWAPISQFCFSAEGGRLWMSVDFEVNKTSAVAGVAWYSETWSEVGGGREPSANTSLLSRATARCPLPAARLPQVHGSSHSCEERVARAEVVHMAAAEGRVRAHVTVPRYWRPQWWYTVLFNCVNTTAEEGTDQSGHNGSTERATREQVVFHSYDFFLLGL